MPTVEEFYKKLVALAPEDLAEDWDPIGPQIYFPKEEVKGLVLCLDLTDQVLNYCQDLGYNLIISHHPVFFNPIKSFDQRTYQGQLLEGAINKKISVLSAHTNLDRAQGGVNDGLAEALGLLDLEPFDLDEKKGNMGYIGVSPFNNFEDLLEHIKEKLSPHHLIAYGKSKPKGRRVGILGGSGADLIDLAKAKGLDLFITADLKYHDGQRAYEEDLCVLDLGHYDTEKFVLNKLKTYFSKDLKEIAIYPKRDFYLDI